MRSSTRDALLGRGIPSDLVKKIADLGHTVASLEASPPVRFAAEFTDEEQAIIAGRLGRMPIPSETLVELFSLSGQACCYCADGLSGKPHQVHHVDGYARSRDHALDNLLLCCPTHHATIHARKVDPTAQRRKRAEWYAMHRVATAYHRRGLPFPFSSFAALWFEGVADPRTVLGPEPPSLPTAVEATRWNIRDAVVASLHKRGFAIVSGASGSGKSTLARGVAGVLRRDEAREAYVYRHHRDPRAALPELLRFLEVVTEPSTLILDDANIWATVDDLEALRAASSAHVWVLATFSSEGDSRTGGRLQTHLGPSMHHVDWKGIRPAVLDYLEANRDVIAVDLARTRTRDDGHRVGQGHTNRSLRTLATGYAQDARTLWHFTHMLSGGAQTADEDLRLHREDRKDAPITYAAIEQIAGFEKTVDLEETTSAVGTALPGAKPPPSTRWVASVFDRLCEERRMYRIRDAYRPVHREWSIQWLDHALFLDGHAGPTGELLRSVFAERTGDPTRIAFLWSWCEGHPNTRAWLSNYLRTFGFEDWQEIVRHLSQDIHALASVGNLLQMNVDTRRLRTFVRAFEANMDQIKAAMPSASWRDRSDLWRLLGSSDLGIAALSAVSPAQGATDLIAAPPDRHDDILWALSSAEKIDPGWLVEVGAHLDVNQFVGDRLERCEPGDLESVFSPALTLVRLSLPIMRSTCRRLGDVAVRVIGDTDLPQLHTGMHPYLWLLARMLPDEMDRVARAFPVARIAKQLAAADPRDWQRLASAMRRFAPDGPPVAAELLDAVDFEAFIQRIEEMAPSHPQDFRVLIWLLTESRAPRRGQFVDRLQNIVRTVVRSYASENEGRAIMRAFWALDAERGQELSAAIGVEPESVDVEFLSPERYEAMRRRVRAVEEIGLDYDVWRTLQGAD